MIPNTYIRLVQIVIITLVKHFLIVTGRLTIARTIPESLPRKNRYLFISNHASYGDPLTLWSVLTFRQLCNITAVKVMTARSVYYSVLKPFIWSLGAFPVRTRNPEYSPIESANSFISQGYSIGIFPEGGRSLQSAKKSYPGVTKIFESHPEVTVVLVHLIWSKAPWWKRKLEVRARVAEKDIDMSDAASIMDAVYQV